MSNVKGKEVSDGSHNVIFAEAGLGVTPALSVEEVASGENVRYKIAGEGEVPNALVEIT